MDYAPPIGNQIRLQWLAGYVGPGGNALQLGFGLPLTEVGAGLEIPAPYASGIDGGCIIRSAIVEGMVGAAVELATRIFESELDLGVEIYRPHAIESTCLIVRGATSPLTAACLIVRGPGYQVERSCEIVRQEMLQIDSGLVVLRTLAAALVEASCLIDARHAALTPVETGLVLVTLDASAPGLHQVIDLPVVTVGGRILTSIVGLQLSANRDQHAITGSLELSDRAEWAALAEGDALSCTLAGRAVLLRVFDRKRNRTHGDWRHTIELQSPSAWLDAPWAEPLTAATLSGRASTVAASLAGSIPLSWQTVDWTIPADGLPAAGQTPLALLRTLAAAAGAVLCSTWEGELLVAPEYPLPVTAWPTTLPAVLIREADEVLAADDDDDWRGGHNAILVATSSANAQTGDIRLEAIDNDDGSKTVRAAAVPWDASIRLSHRGGSWVQLALAGDQWREETETVQIVDGQGRTRQPCHQVLASDWLEHELGALAASEDGLITSATAGDSLLAITYRTLARCWTLRDQRQEEVMVVAETDDQAAGAGISVLVTRGAGDRRGADVVDPLLTDVAVARERGRNLIDAGSTRRQIVTLTCPFAELLDHGALVEVREAADGPWRGLLRGQSISLAVADDGAPTWDTVLTIEREAA